MFTFPKHACITTSAQTLARLLPMKQRETFLSISAYLLSQSAPSVITAQCCPTTPRSSLGAAHQLNTSGNSKYLIWASDWCSPHNETRGFTAHGMASLLLLVLPSKFDYSFTQKASSPFESNHWSPSDRVAHFVLLSSPPKHLLQRV